MTPGEARRYETSKIRAKYLGLMLEPNETFSTFVITDRKEGEARHAADHAYSYTTLEQVEAFLEGADYIDFHKKHKQNS